MNGYKNKQIVYIRNDKKPHKIQEQSVGFMLATGWVYVSLETILTNPSLPMENTIGQLLSNSFDLNCMIWIPKACDFNRAVLYTTQLVSH